MWFAEFILSSYCFTIELEEGGGFVLDIRGVCYVWGWILIRVC